MRTWPWLAFVIPALLLAGIFLWPTDPADVERASEQQQQQSRQDSSRRVWEFDKELSDGRTVTCLFGSHGALDCDWAGAK